MEEIQTKGFNKTLNKARAEKIIYNATGKTCLEVGSGFGQISKYLAGKFEKVVSVEICEECVVKSWKHRNIELIHSDFLSFKTDEKFDFIVCSNVLEHVEDPIKFLQKIRDFGHEKSTYFFSVPNANSQNRILGVEMGFIPNTEHLDKQDIDAGHKRMYTLETFENDIASAEFKINTLGTFIYKPFHNELMKTLPNQIIKKCINTPVKNIGAEIYAICKHGWKV